ncbi:MAG: lipid hydroperoxide peroxidase [SAR324 cluster bacterium]|uniref:Thiol peroxidase n=1 Tax=SAR324 cluster bacterium TaxID=2024889 RepID=A0A2A4T118_9DELT|nr:MAG: lipid hydroperoxide peroxidase [SAR324 cluster bacterium]
MAQTKLKGNVVQTIGDLPSVGSQIPGFQLVKNDLSSQQLSDLQGKKIVFNIFPSIDTGVCATSVRKFNEEAGKLENTVVLCVSRDLPFALGRFCGAEGLENVTALSDFRSGDFGKAYGVELTDGPLAALMARAVVVADETGKVVYTELVPEITEEPNYEKALAALA